jgi:hypothetical protein
VDMMGYERALFWTATWPITEEVEGMIDDERRYHGSFACVASMIRNRIQS